MLNPIILNILYAVFGAVLTLAFVWTGCKLFGRLFKVNISDELKHGNSAVGLVVMGMLIGNGIAIGLVIGLALN